MFSRFFISTSLLFSFAISFGQTVTFNYTGGQQQWTVPAGVNSVTFTVAGAKGGGSNGGNGAIITKTCYSVTPGQILYIYVGGMGTQGSFSGGWNGGGTGHNSTGSATYRSWGGGGASDIRIGGTALANRVIVGGGGGGRSGGSGPVCGGAANCNNGAAGCATFGAGGGGGTQFTGGNGGAPWAGTPPGGQAGTIGQGGQGGYWQTASGGGGGGGLYGGGGGGNDGCCTGGNGGGGGGAGSSLVPAGGTCVAGGNTNNGYVTITVSTIAGVTASNTGPYCPGQTIQLNSAGGGTYSWTGPNGFTSTLQNPTIPNLTAASIGTYTVVVNSAGCSASATTTIVLNTGSTVTLTPTAPACASATNGSINVVSTGSTPGYNVSWTGPSTGNPAGTEIASSGGSYVIPSLGVGTYTVTVGSSNGCNTITTTTITANAGVTGSATFVSPLCAGSSNGNATVSASNGVAPYQISWTGTSTGNPAGDEISSATGTYLISNLLAGNYSITITDAVGCFYSFPLTISQPAILTASALNTSTLCNGSSNGTVTGTATGGTSPYDMSWTGPNTGNPAGTEINASGGSYTVNGAPSGAYTLTMTDANGCTTTTTTNLAQPLPLSASATNTPALCNGSADGTITVTATDGTAGYNVSWTGPVNGAPAGTEIASSGGNYTITGVSNGSYTVTITDLNGCTTTTTSTITQPVSLTASATNTAALCNGSADGTITVTSTNGTPAYNVSWAGPVNGNPAGTEIGTSGGNYTITGASAGTYTITVTDLNGCTATTTSTITEPVLLTATATNTSVLCNGGTTGSVSATATNGTAPYNMSWAGPVTGDPAGTEIALSGGNYSVNNAPAGLYTITITDANGCVTTTTTTIIEPVLLTAAAANTGALCNGSSDGTVTGTAIGGATPYDMSWAGPNTGNPAGTEINADGGSYTVNGAPAGSYTLTMTDANGCTATTTTNLAQPLPLSASATNTPALCNGSADGTITVTATDGTAGYNVSWTGPSNDDPIGEEITISGGNYTIIGLNPGAFTMTITDLNGCTTTTTSTITQPVSLTASATNTAALCNGSADGTITVTSTNGTPAYNVSWAGPVNGNPAGTEIGTSGGNYTITGASAGTYTITVTDLNGCTATTTSTITEPVLLTATATNTSVLCNGGTTGSVSATATNGTAPYNMSWAGPVTGDPAGTEIALSGGNYSVNNAPAGLYTITITDANGCVTTTTTTIIEPVLLTAAAANTGALCNGSSDGTVTGTAIGGATPYDMSWAGPNTGNPAGTEINADGGSYTVNGAPAGSYTLTMTDANGCTATATTNVAQPLPIVVSSVITPPLCNGATNGVLNINVIGGFPGYNVSWLGPISDNPAGIEIVNNGGSYQINNLSAGTYTVVATDVNGCTDSIVSTLIPPPSLSFTAVVSNISCNGGVGSILVTASNGTPGYDVSWVGPITSNPVGTEINVSGGTYTITALTSGNYQITVTDQNGCFDSSSVTLLEPTLIQSTSIETSTLCQNSNDGSTQITVTGGVSPYNLSLSGSVSYNPLGNEITVSGGNYSFSNLAAGNYTVTVLDANNCSSTLAITILAGNILPVITLVGDTICTGQSATLNASATPVGGTFLWGNGTSNPSITISPIVTTQYAVLYNYSGCMSQLTVSVVVNPIPTVSVANSTICEGQSATLSAASMQPIGGTFLWSTGATTSTISVSPQNTTNYTLVYTLNGCSSPSASATVSVNPIPQLTINNATICEGDSVILTATPNLPGGTILWTPNGETTNSITANPLVTSTYSAVYTLNGCPSSSFSTNVTVNPIPVVSFDADLLQGCAPLATNFWNNSANANQSTNTQWFIEGNPVAVGDSATLLFSNAGCYDISLEMTVNGCIGSQTYSNFVCVEGIPVASFSTDINYFTEPSQNATFTNNSVGATTYFWNTGDGNTYTTEDLSHLFNNTGNGYTIWLTAMSDLGCVDSTSINISFMDEIVYYIPNSFTPDGDEFNNIFTPVFTAGIDYHTYEMTIFNRWGEIVFETQDPQIGWDGSYGNQGLDVQLGVYTYKISFKTPQLDDRREILGHVNVVR